MLSAQRRLALCGCVVILAMQGAMAADAFRDQFLNTCYNYTFDNAFFTTAARHANALGAPANRWGVVEPGAHHCWNEPAAPPSFYTHHPYGLKLLMQQVMRFTGHTEVASRGFSLAVAMCAALGMFATLSIGCGSPLCGAIGAGVFVSLPVMATYQTCVKFEIDGMAASAWVVPCIAVFLNRPTRFSRGLVLVAGVAAALSSWTSLMFAALMSGALVVPGVIPSSPAGGSASRSAGIVLAAGVTLGTMLLLSLFVWQKGGMAAFVAELAGVFRVHSERKGFTNVEWLERQWRYGLGSFGIVGLALLGAGVVMIVREAFKLRILEAPGSCKRQQPRLLFLFLCVSMATTVLWVVVFREGSHCHDYWSMVACMPIAAAAAALVNGAPPACKTAAYGIGALVVLGMYLTSWQAFASRLESWRAEGTGPDVEFVMSFRHERFNRFVFVPLGDHPFNIWFHPRLFEYYTDRTVVPAASAGPVGNGDKVIVLAYDEQQAAEDFVQQQFGIRLANRRCGPRFCVYDALPESDADGDASPTGN